MRINVGAAVVELLPEFEDEDGIAWKDVVDARQHLLLGAVGRDLIDQWVVVTYRIGKGYVALPHDFGTDAEALIALVAACDLPAAA